LAVDARRLRLAALTVNGSPVNLSQTIATTFDVQVSTPAETPTDTPTLPQWGLIGMAALLFGYAATQLRTRLHVWCYAAVLLIMLALVLVPIIRKRASRSSPSN